MPGSQRGDALGPRPYGWHWQQYRLGFLRLNPLCLRCQQAGRTVAATVVDHIEPHNGNQARFWAPENHQALCKPCHDGDKKRLEKSGVNSYRGAQTDGTPLDPSHQWNKAG